MNLDSILKSRDNYFADKGPPSQSYSFCSSYVWMWELDYKESWALKNWCFWIVVLEKTPESPLDCNEIKPVNRKKNQSWIFIGRTDAEAETPILWPRDVKNWLRRRPLRVSWTAWRWNQSILKDISPEYSLEGLMLKLKRQYFGCLMLRANSVEKSKGRRWRGQQRISWLNGISDSMDMSLSELQEIVDRAAWGERQLQTVVLLRVGHSLVTEQQQPYTSFIIFKTIYSSIQ